LYRDRSPAKSLLVTLHESRSWDSLECTIQHLAIRSHDLDQPRILPRKTVPSAPLFTIRGMHAQMWTHADKVNNENSNGAKPDRFISIRRALTCSRKYRQCQENHGSNYADHNTQLLKKRSQFKARIRSYRC